MRSFLILGVAVGLLASFAGCANNAIVAHETAGSGTIYGNLGIKGNNNVRTVQADSRLDKVSIWGDGNSVLVEDDVLLRKVEVFGSNNTITVPEGLVVRFTEWGTGNQLLRRPRGTMSSTDVASRTRLEPAPQSEGGVIRAEDVQPVSNPGGGSPNMP